MGEMILCHSKIAAMPYYIENIAWNVYSIDELCYYMESYPDRMDIDFFDGELCDWLMQQLDEVELGEQLMRLRNEKRPLIELVECIAMKSGYMTKNSWQELAQQLNELEGKDAFSRARLSADRTQKNHHYAECILKYYRLLKEAEHADVGAAEVGDIWHNMGVACANMFLYREAADCFRKAYRYNENTESLFQMYFARQFVLEESGEDSLNVAEEYEEQVMERLQKAVDEVEGISIDTSSDALEQWKKKYRMYSQQ